MTKFETLKMVTDAEKFSELIFDLIRFYDTSTKFTAFLKEELPQKELQTLESIAQAGYPLSLERKQ